jgi:hypothetical protein
MDKWYIEEVKWMGNTWIKSQLGIMEKKKNNGLGLVLLDMYV